MARPMAQKEYIKKGGVRCPVCRSGNIEGTEVTIDAGGASQDIECLDCGATWADLYKLVGFELLGS